MDGFRVALHPPTFCFSVAAAHMQQTIIADLAGKSKKKEKKRIFDSHNASTKVFLIFVHSFSKPR